MEKKISQVGPVEYEMEINLSAEDLAPKIQEALRTQRTRTQMKGFRPGKVPLNMVKRMYGKALAYEIAEKSIQETYEREILESDDYDVLGQPKLTELEYEMDQDLRAVVRFGVRPEVELQDLSGEKVTKLVHQVSDEDVDQEIEQLRLNEAEMVPNEGEAGEEDFVVVDIQRLDDASGTPIIGEKEEGVQFFLNDPRLKEELRQALLGKKGGDTFRVDLPHEGAHEEAPQSEILELPTPSGEKHGASHTHAYQVTVKEVKHRELPELDEVFIKEATEGQFESAEALREALRERLESAWEQRSREYLEGKIVERMLELHPVPVPDSAVELYLDSFVEDVKQRNQGELPEGFDEVAFRAKNREEAERQARWMLIRDEVIEEEALEVEEEDWDAFFEEAARESEREMPPETLRQIYGSMPGLMEQLEQRLLSKKVYEALVERFEVVEKDRDALEREIEERRAAEAAGAEEASS